MTDLSDDLVNLHHIPTSLTGSKGREFVCDCTRAAEGLLSDQEIKEKYELSPADWESITKNTTLIRAIQSERTRRVRTGQAAREAAAQHFTKAPKILDQLMTNETVSVHSRIEAIRVHWQPPRRKRYCGEARCPFPRSSAFVHATRPPGCLD
jgi:hypothetical protein